VRTFPLGGDLREIITSFFVGKGRKEEKALKPRKGEGIVLYRGNITARVYWEVEGER